jgi:hypothetical protein
LLLARGGSLSPFGMIRSSSRCEIYYCFFFAAWRCVTAYVNSQLNRNDLRLSAPLLLSVLCIEVGPRHISTKYVPHSIRQNVRYLNGTHAMHHSLFSLRTVPTTLMGPPTRVCTPDLAYHCSELKHTVPSSGLRCG